MTTSGATSASSIGDTGSETMTTESSTGSHPIPSSGNAIDRYIGLQRNVNASGLSDLIGISEPTGRWWKCLSCHYLFLWPCATAGVAPITHLRDKHGFHFGPSTTSTLQRVTVDVCENCLTRARPGTCATPGCLFRDRDLGDVPDLTGAELVTDPPWMAVMSNPLKLGILATACQNFLDGWDDEQGGTARYGTAVRQLMDILAVPTGQTHETEATR